MDANRALTIEQRLKHPANQRDLQPKGSSVSRAGQPGVVGSCFEVPRAAIRRKAAGTTFAADSLSMAHWRSREIMNLRYVVVRREDEWKIVQGGRRHSGSYTSQRLALCAAIEFAEQHGRAGRRVEVLVRQEDGHFSTEWVFGRGLAADAEARPILTPIRN
jgi:hypothetical protein